MAQKQTKKAEQGKEPLKCTYGNCQKLQCGDGEFCEEHLNTPFIKFARLVRGKAKWTPADCKKYGCNEQYGHNCIPF